MEKTSVYLIEITKITHTEEYEITPDALRTLTDELKERLNADDVQIKRIQQFVRDEEGFVE